MHATITQLTISSLFNCALEILLINLFIDGILSLKIANSNFEKKSFQLITVPIFYCIGFNRAVCELKFYFTSLA